MTETAEKTKALPRGLIRLCPECGSGDVRWCSISVRPYCADCHTWGSVNFGAASDAIKAWNTRASAKLDLEVPPYD